MRKTGWNGPCRQAQSNNDRCALRFILRMHEKLCIREACGAHEAYSANVLASSSSSSKSDHPFLPREACLRVLRGV